MLGSTLYVRSIINRLVNKLVYAANATYAIQTIFTEYLRVICGVCVVNVGSPVFVRFRSVYRLRRIVRKRLEAGKMEGLNVVVDCTYVYSKSRIHPRNREHSSR